MIQGLLNGKVLTASAAAGSSAKGSLPAVGLSTIPYAVAGLTVVLASAHAQRRRELFLHGALPLLASGIIIALFPVLAAAHPVAGFVGLVATLSFGLAANPSISSILALLHKGPHEVVALPLFDTIVNVGAVIGAPLAGVIVQKTTTGFTIVAVLMGCLICVAALLVLALGAWVAHGPMAEALHLRPRRCGRMVASGAGAAATAAEGTGAPVVIKVDDVKDAPRA
jgi:predicted MFS family arabinose efflux permease